MLVALFIMSLTVAFTMFVVGAVGGVRDAAYENIAFRIADSKLDELRAGGYDALPADGPFFDPGLASLPQGQASTSVTVWNTKTKQVMTGVSWQGVNGSTRAVSFTTLLTQSGGL